MIQEAKTKKLKWLLVSSPTKKNLAYLWDNFPVSNEDLAITLPPLQRPRVVPYKDYTLVILQMPYYDKTSREIRSSELDMFIGRDYVITVTDGKLSALNLLFDYAQDHPEKITKEYKDDPGLLVHSILNELLMYQFPMLNRISQDLDAIENVILEDAPTHKDAIQNILTIKRNIANFRRISQTHRHIIQKISEVDQHFTKSESNSTRLQDLMGHTYETWTTLEGYRETVNALHETHESLLNFRTNQVIKTLTVFSVIVFPLTLLAAIFGMNTAYMPLVNDVSGFWIILGVMFVGALVMYFYFKHRKWI